MALRIVLDDLAGHALLQLLAPEGWQLFIHYPSRKQLPARVHGFVDFCIEHLGGHADLSADVTGFMWKR